MTSRSEDSLQPKGQDGSTKTGSTTVASSLTYWQKRYREKPGEKERRAVYAKKYYPKHKADFRKREVLPKAMATRKAYSRRRQGMEDLTQEQWEALFERQGRACAICKRKNPGQSIVKGRWVADHDHKTGRIRGILCRRCNMALAMFFDSKEVIQQVLSYLE